MPPSDAPRHLDAATVLLVRGDDARRQCFWVQRSREVSNGGGFFAMPGGRVDATDLALAARFGPIFDEPGLNKSVETTALALAAIRETFEETGVLLARGTFSTEGLDEHRRALLGNHATFESILDHLHVTPDFEALKYGGRWLTPPFVKSRFDARFFVARMPDGQSASVWPGELAAGEWIEPGHAIERWNKGSALLHPPALHLLRCLRDAPFPACLPAMRTPPDVVDFVAERIEFQANVLLVPVRTPTLPPATHTNCFLVGGDELVVVDPGSLWPEEQRYLSRVANLLRAEGRKFREILITHHHHDHVDGVEAFAKEFGIPVRAHAETVAALEGRVKVDGVIEPDERIVLPGAMPLRLRALHTPGHTRGHLCFLEETTGALLAGDHVAGIGTVVVDPPDGDMSDYVKSLEFLRLQDIGAIYPAHGPVVPDGPRKLDEYLAHRAAREAGVLLALSSAGPADVDTLVPLAYPEIAPAVYPLAARSLTSVLLKLEKEGRAVRDGAAWKLTLHGENP